MKTPPLSAVQLFVLTTLKDGGKLIREDATNELFFDDIDGNTYKIIQPTSFKLAKNGLITEGHPPCLGFTSFIVTKKGIEEIQEAELKVQKYI